MLGRLCPPILILTNLDHELHSPESWQLQTGPFQPWFSGSGDPTQASWYWLVTRRLWSNPSASLSAVSGVLTDDLLRQLLRVAVHGSLPQRQPAVKLLQELLQMSAITLSDSQFNIFLSTQWYMVRLMNTATLTFNIYVSMQ